VVDEILGAEQTNEKKRLPDGRYTVHLRTPFPTRLSPRRLTLVFISAISGNQKNVNAFKHLEQRRMVMSGWFARLVRQCFALTH
jgi:hypothetical protein